MLEIIVLYNCKTLVSSKHCPFLAIIYFHIHWQYFENRAGDEMDFIVKTPFCLAAEISQCLLMNWAKPRHKRLTFCRQESGLNNVSFEDTSHAHMSEYFCNPGL